MGVTAREAQVAERNGEIAAEGVASRKVGRYQAVSEKTSSKHGHQRKSKATQEGSGTFVSEVGSPAEERHHQGGAETEWWGGTKGESSREEEGQFRWA